MKCTKWEWLVVCEKLMKCLPELDSGAFLIIRFWNEGEAPARGASKGAGRCDGKEGQCVKVMGIVSKRNLALMRNDEMHEMEVDCSM